MIKIKYERYIDLLKAEAMLKLLYDTMEEMFDIEEDHDALQEAFYDTIKEHDAFKLRVFQEQDIHSIDKGDYSIEHYKSIIDKKGDSNVT